MRRLFRTIGFILLAGLSVYAILFGLVYATRTEMMPHHHAVLPDAVSAQVMPLYQTLMRLAGGAIAAFGLTCLYVVFGPMRAGFKGASSAVSVLLSAFFAATALTAARLEVSAGSATHWQVMGLLAVLALIGWASTLFGSRSN